MVSAAASRTSPVSSPSGPWTYSAPTGLDVSLVIPASRKEAVLA
ncbi:Uncharacterised protein [Mycobacteroides abscessus subsp. abscessus]|nr:Uncharacterised protein [Mycobacteroides abscessus subsp. abscessus]